MAQNDPSIDAGAGQAQPAPPSPTPPVAQAAPRVSLVLLIHNHGDQIPALYRELRAVLAPTDEIIAVDDGSRDGSFEALRQLAAADPLLRVVRLRRAFGRSAALMAGFDRARGSYIVTFDANRQTSPADIPRLLAPLEQGYDFVSGWRRSSQSPPQIAFGNWLISLVTGVRLHDYGSPLKAFRADVVQELTLYGDLYRFLPAIASWQGVRITEVEVQGQPGTGKPRRGAWWRGPRVLLDLITIRFLLGYGVRPMQSFGLFGGLMLFIGTLLSLYLLFVKFGLGFNIGERPLLLLAVLLALVGIQFLVLGLLAEMIIRIYHESLFKPTYVTRAEVRDGIVHET